MVRHVTHAELAAVVDQLNLRIDEQALIEQRRVGALERDHYKLAGEKYSAIEWKVSGIHTEINDVRLTMANRFDRQGAQISRTDKMLELLLRERGISLPPEVAQ